MCDRSCLHLILLNLENVVGTHNIQQDLLILHEKKNEPTSKQYFNLRLNETQINSKKKKNET